MNERMVAPRSELAELVEEHLGFHPEAPGSADWGSILEARVGITKSGSLAAYRKRLTPADLGRTEVGELARVMTVGETYFFRDTRQFEALTKVVLPDLMARRRADAPIRLLSVACSSGEEPYSVAIAARELLGNRAERVRIHAFDINPTAISRARRGVYTDWALRATPTALRERYFTRSGSQYVLAESVRSSVSLDVRNLFDQDLGFWAPGSFDVILCRNALIYFSHRKIAAALAQLAAVLAPDGTLFLGHAETTRGFSERFAPIEVCGTFCHRLRSATEPHQAPSSSTPAQSGARTSVPSIRDDQASSALEPSTADGSLRAPAPLATDAWVTAIEAATQRVANLVATRASSHLAQSSGSSAPIATTVSINAVRELVARERFAEALQKLDELVAAEGTSSSITLWRALILTNQARLVEASDLCRRVLSDNPHSAGAYHLLGVAAEHQGRFDEALGHHETAVTLDSKFAMSHWLLGRLHLRRARREPARRHLTRALELWEREVSGPQDDGELYAGGFGRETLIRLCRVDLGRCEAGR